ncbi:MAG TPA: maleylpyruvate isomerase N-terminal domain-containing protein, partial [Pseudonocardiaceae bacterium]
MHGRVMATSVAVVAGVSADDLGRPTPCAGWDLRRLLAHMTGQNHGFAAAAGGAGPDPALFADRHPGAVLAPAATVPDA